MKIIDERETQKKKRTTTKKNKQKTKKAIAGTEAIVKG